MPYTDPDSVFNPASGLAVPAAYLDVVNADLNHLFQQALGSEAAWSTWTPALTAATTSPTLGSGALQQGRYAKRGRLVVARWKIKFGTAGTAAGTGEYRVSLPVAADTTITAALIGSYFLFDASSLNVNTSYVTLLTSTTCRMEYPATWPAGTATGVGAAAPWAWSTNDELHGLVAYESAA